MDEPNDHPHLEDLWQFAGQGLRSSDFTSAMIHFYRGEMSRSNMWRTRLDNTTNWAVLTTGAALSFAFSSPDNTHIVIIIDTIMLLIFLFIEARRYRYYELWTSRVRLMEKNFFANLLSPPFLPNEQWAEEITHSLLHPQFPISLREAFGRRYRRTYAPLFMILALSWIFKVFIHPIPATNLETFLQNASFDGNSSGWISIILGLIFNGFLIFVGLFTLNLQEAQGEVFESKNIISRFFHYIQRATSEALETELYLPRLPKFEKRKQLAYIISNEVEQISEILLKDLARGVTLLHATGMHTKHRQAVLMCAMEEHQVPRCKALVHQIDPQAFVIITPVEQILGQGFRPLETF